MRTSLSRLADLQGVGGFHPATWLVALLCAATVAPALFGPPGSLPGQATVPVDGAHGAFLFSVIADRMAGQGSLLHLSEMWAPGGRPLLLAIQNLVDAVLVAPLTWALGLERGVSLFTALLLLSNALSGAWVARGVRASPLAEVAGAVVLGFCPFVWGEVEFGRTTQAWLAPTALAVGLGWRAAAEPTLRKSLLAGAALALTGYHYWFYGLFGAVAVAGAVLGRAGLRGVKPLATIAASALVLVAPFVAYVALAWAEVPGSESQSRFVIGAAWHSGLPLSGVASDLYVPHGILVLALLALFAPGAAAGSPAVLPRGRRLWLLGAAILLALIATGDSVRVGGSTVYLPYAWLRQLPPLQRFWWPNRALCALTVGLIPLVVLGLTSWPRARVVAALALPLAVLQCWLAPGRPGTYATPAVGQWHRDLPAGAVLVLPMTSPHAGMRALLQQPHHDRPLVNGMSMWDAYLWPPEYRAWFDQQPLLVALEQAEAGRPARAQTAAVSTLAEAGVVGIVMDRAFIEGPRDRHPEAFDTAAELRLLTELLGEPTCPDAQCYWAL